LVSTQSLNASCASQQKEMIEQSARIARDLHDQLGEPDR